MQNKSGIVRVAGILCIVFIVVTIAWYLLGFSVSSDLQQVGADLQYIASNPAHFLGFLSVDIIYSMIIFFLGAILYLIFRRYSQSGALFGLIGFVVTAAMWMILDVPRFAQYPLALEYSQATGTTADAIALMAANLSLTSEYIPAVPETFYGIGLIAFGILIVRTKVVHVLLGRLAILAGVLMLVSWANTLHGSLIWNIAYYISEAWILLIGIWLLVKGIKEPASGTEPMPAPATR